MEKIKKLLAMSILTLILSGCSQYISRTDWAEVNGQRLFYAVEGPSHGMPVLLLHGNGGNHSKLETTQRQLAQAGYLVFGLDSRGQGANEALEEYHYADMAEDAYCFIQTVIMKQVYRPWYRPKKDVRPVVFGWSDGGILALMLESMHPGTCRAIVSSGANISCHDYLAPNDWMTEEPDMPLEEMEPLMRLMYLEPNMTEEDLSRIQCPTLIVAGENDIIRRDHTEKIARLVPGAELLIVPGHDHGSHIKYNPLMGEIILDFVRKTNRD